MGVSGCGKSMLGRAISGNTGLAYIEGDDFHAPESVRKMRSGIALSDEDRSGWLDRLAQQLRDHRSGAVLSCSSLKEAYRNRLRGAVDRLRFVYLEIDVANARSRVAARPGHIFPASLVDSQFAALEAPAPGPDVLVLSAIQPPSLLCAQALEWLGRNPRS